MEIEDVQKKKILDKVNARLKQKIPDFQKRILKIDKNAEIKITKSLLVDMLSVIFGFNRESEINELAPHTEKNLLLGISIKNGMICLVEGYPLELKLVDSDFEQTIDHGLSNKFGLIVRTNCLDWKIYRSKCENHKQHDLVYAFKFLELDSKNDADLIPLYNICKEAHEPETDIYNRLQWHGFIGADKKTIDYIFLVRSIYFKDGSAKFTVPYLNETFRCDEGSAARIHAKNAIENFVRDEFGKNYENEDQFVTVAYYRETESMKKNIPIWW